MIEMLVNQATEEEAIEITPEMRFFQSVFRSTARPKTEVSVY